MTKSRILKALLQGVACVVVGLPFVIVVFLLDLLANGLLKTKLFFIKMHKKTIDKIPQYDLQCFLYFEESKKQKEAKARLIKQLRSLSD